MGLRVLESSRQPLLSTGCGRLRAAMLSAHRARADSGPLGLGARALAPRPPLPVPPRPTARARAPARGTLETIDRRTGSNGASKITVAWVGMFMWRGEQP